MIKSESYSIDTSEPGFVGIRHVQKWDNGADLGGEIWFERGSLPWVVDTLRACTTTYGFPETSAQKGDDNLQVFESGPEQEPFVNLYNQRPAGSAHGGKYARGFSKPVALRLVDELAGLK